MNQHNDNQYRKLISHWTLRALNGFNYKRYLRSASMDPTLDNDVLFAVLCEDEFIEIDHFTSRTEANELKRLVNKKRKQLSETAPSLPGGHLSHNINWLSNRLNLTAIEEKVLSLVVMSNLYYYFKSAIREFGELDFRGVIEITAIMLDESAQDICSALQPTSRLVISGLLKINSGRTDDLFSKVELMHGIADLLNTEFNHPDEILQYIVKKSTPSILTRSDFNYIEAEYRIATDYVKAVLNNKTKGCNILLYGEPGTGKTEFAKSICNTIDIPLYTVSSRDPDGDPVTGNQRLSAFLLSQNILDSSYKSAIIFDEIEDIFPAQNNFIFNLISNRSQAPKAWLNEILECNSIPTFWISNRIDHIDPAYLRRFDLSIKLKVPGRNTRKSIIKNYFSGLPVSDSWIENKSKHAEITPATFEKLSKVMRSLSIVNESDTEDVLDRILSNKQQALGKPLPKSQPKYHEFNPELLNISFSPERLLNLLQKQDSCSICFYGPPGSGKTGFAHYISTQIDKPIISKKMSDLISKWVGETENNIASAFEHASDENAILLIDEIDGLLRDRRFCNNSWEVTQVNELLTQIENFCGVFIATSNLIENLDQASLRRFNLKIKFNYLSIKQSVSLFKELLFRLNIEKRIDKTTYQLISKLNLLTPADFELIYNNSAMNDNPHSIADIIKMLEDECQFKSEKSNPIGFL